jgi:hypothetical protein
MLGLVCAVFLPVSLCFVRGVPQRGGGGGGGGEGAEAMPGGGGLSLVQHQLEVMLVLELMAQPTFDLLAEARSTLDNTPSRR